MAVNLLTTVTVAVTLLSISSARVSQNAVASVLQDILSPGNTDKAIQLIKLAATRSNKKVAIPEMARALACGELALPPRAVCNDYLPARAVVANDYLPARTVVANDYLPARTLIAKDYLPAIVNELPVRMIANDGYARAVPEIAMQSMRQVPVQQFQPSLMDSLTLPKEMFQPFPVAQPQETIVRPCQALPPGSNPYLPIASPVSAMTPGSLPAPTQSKGQFLRKIPIPPPTL